MLYVAYGFVLGLTVGWLIFDIKLTRMKRGQQFKNSKQDSKLNKAKHTIEMPHMPPPPPPNKSITKVGRSSDGKVIFLNKNRED